MDQENLQIDIITIPKEKIREYLFEHKNKLYNYVFGHIIEELDFKTKRLVITLDKKDGNKILRTDLDNYITKKVKERKFSAKITIEHVESHCNEALQVTDFIAWAVNRKYSFDDDLYYKIFEKKIRTQKNLWE